MMPYYTSDEVIPIFSFYKFLVMKSKVSLSLMFEIGLLNASLTLSIEYIDSTILHERCTIFQKLALSGVKIFVLNDRKSIML